MKKLSLAAIGALALSLVTLLVLRFLSASPTPANAAAAPPVSPVQPAGAAPAAATANLPMVHYQAQSTNTTVAIQGTSTFHDWEMKGTAIGGWVEFPAGTTFDLSQATLPGLKEGNLPATVKATILVRTLKSQAEHLPDVMDNLMQGAMKQTNFPAIQYAVTELKLKTPHVAGQPFAFDATGNLAIAGVTNKVTFPVTIAPLGTGKILISGTAALKMTAFKVEPPAPNILGLGLMKCGDDIKVPFSWTLLQTSPKLP
jgi:polyisoprenoid-binding protein YceI